MALLIGRLLLWIKWNIQYVLSFCFLSSKTGRGPLRSKQSPKAFRIFSISIPLFMFVLIVLNVSLETGMSFEFLPKDEYFSVTNQSLLSFNKSDANFSTTSSDAVKTVADVQGANMDHSGSISNPCMTKVSLLKMAIMDEPISPFSPVGIHSFILRSAYRISANVFVALGLSPLSLHHSKSKAHNYCFWHASNGNVIRGSIYILWPGEHHDLTYESIIYRCELMNFIPSSSAGSLFLHIDDEDVVVYKESSTMVSLYKPPEKLKHKIAVCSFPLYRDANPQRILEWIQYMYHNMAVEYFLLNDGGSVDKEMISVLRSFINAGVVEVNDIRAQFKYESKHNVLTLNDCLYSMRFKTEWLLFLDFDEFLYVEAPHTLPSLLDQHKDAPFFTFGSLWWSTSICRAPMETGEWPLEKMIFHWPKMYCVGLDQGYTEGKCLNYFGHRKYLVNPRKVWAVEVHRPIEPIDGGVNFNTSLIHINHYQGLLRRSMKLCNELIGEKTPDWWKEGHHLANLATRAKKLGGPGRRLNYIN